MSWKNNDTSGGGQWGSGTACNPSFEDDDGGAGNGGDRPSGACYNCGEDGHNKADCLKPRIMRCRHCNEEGHTMRTCPDPNCPPQEQREFNGECHTCGKEGHRAAECPDRPPMMCRNCNQEGHQTSECQNARFIDRSHAADVAPGKAWEKIALAAREHDMDDVKEAIKEYLKSSPELTYAELEHAFRTLGIQVYIIAVEKKLIGALTNMDLQGNMGKKYTITYRFDPKPVRERERSSFPEDTEDNMKRLQDAGEPVNSGKHKCNNCDEYGHTSKSCPSDRVEKEQIVIKCYNCGEEGHRVRDCSTPRIDKFACKNCNQPGHKVSECPEPPNPTNVDCRKCGEKGHFSRDCPQGGGGGGSGACHNCGHEGHRARDCTEPKKIICRNCDDEGHTGRECPKPRDYSRVKCSNCGEMGHTRVRCKQAIHNPDADNIGGYSGVDTAEAVPGSDNGGYDAFSSGEISNNFGGGDTSGAYNSGVAGGCAW